MRRESIRAVRPPLEGDHRADVVVVGGGLGGCLATLELARQRCDVVLLEAGTVGSASAAESHLPTGPHEAYTHVVERVGRAAALAVWESGREGHHGLRDLARGLGGAEGHRARGGFLLATDRAGGLALADSEDLLREDGFSSEFLDHYMLEARFDVRGVTAALWMTDDGEMDLRALCAAIAAEAEARGARIHEGAAAVSAAASAGGAVVATARGSVAATQAIVTAGAGTLRLLPGLAGALQEQAATRLSCSPGTLQVPTPTRFLQGSLAWARWGEVVHAVATGGAPEEALRRYLPLEDGTRIAAAPASLLRTADGLPLVGRVGPGLFVSCAHDAVGASLAAVAARWTAAAALGAQDPTPEPFRASRVLAGGALPQ